MTTAGEILDDLDLIVDDQANHRRHTAASAVQTPATGSSRPPCIHKKFARIANCMSLI